LEKIVKIIETDWSEIKPVWSKFLWPLKTANQITSTSSMVFLGGYNLDIKKNRPSFWIARCDDVVVGTISGFKTSPNQFRSRGIWVADSYRGQGISFKLFEVVEARALEYNCNSIWSYPRVSALPAYLKFGFFSSGEIIHSDDPYTPHIYAEKKL